MHIKHWGSEPPQWFVSEGSFLTELRLDASPQFLYQYHSRCGIHRGRLDKPG